MSEYKLPKKWDLYKFTGLPIFNKWDKGIQANTNYNQKKEQLNNLRKKLRIGSYSLVILAIFISNVAGKHSNLGFLYLFMLVLAFLIRKHGFITRILVDEKLDEAYAVWQQALYEHTDIFINPLAEKFLVSGSYSYRIGQICLIYGTDGFVYFDTYNSLLVVCDKSNIKDVRRERLFTGSTTEGSSNTLGGAYTTKSRVTLGGANTQTHTNTVNEYEWHFDISINLLDYPTVSFVLYDSKDIEDFIGKAYAILKP